VKYSTQVYELEGFRRQSRATKRRSRSSWQKISGGQIAGTLPSGRGCARTPLDPLRYGARFFRRRLYREISRALAEAGISILSISTYRTDAVLVHESRFTDAVAAVKRA
jgi:hypothetical protein